MIPSSAKATFEQYIQKNLPLLPPDTSAGNYGTEINRVYKTILEERRRLWILKRLKILS